jgi:hypothetical protein
MAVFHAYNVMAPMAVVVGRDSCFLKTTSSTRPAEFPGAQIRISNVAPSLGGTVKVTSRTIRFHPRGKSESGVLSVAIIVAPLRPMTWHRITPLPGFSPE